MRHALACALIAWTATVSTIVCRDVTLTVVACPAPATGTTTVTAVIVDDKGATKEAAHVFTFNGAPSDLAVNGTINNYLWQQQYPVPAAPVLAPSAVYTK